MKRGLLTLLALIAWAGIAQAYPPACAPTTATGAAGTVTGSHPSCATTGMAEIALVANLTSQPTFTPPSGWTLIDSANTAAGTASTYWHCFTSGDPAPQWTISPTNGAQVQITIHDDVNCSSPIDKHELQTFSSANMTASSLTPTSANEDVDGQVQFGLGTWAVPIGFIDLGSASPAGTSFGAGYWATGGTTATGAKTFMTGTSSGWVSMITLNPPRGGQAWTGVRGVTFSNTDTAIPIPTNIQSGDAIMAFADCSTASTSAVTPPSGFNQVRDDVIAVGFGNSLQSFCYTATGAESGTWNFSVGNKCSNQTGVLIIDTFNSGCPADASAGVSNVTATVNVTTPTVSAIKAKEMIISGVVNHASTATVPFVPALKSISTANGSMSASLYDQATSGTSTGQTFTFTSDSNIAQTIAMTNTSTPKSLSGGSSHTVFGQMPMDYLRWYQNPLPPLGLGVN